MSRKKAREAVFMAFYQTEVGGAEPNDALAASMGYLEQEQKISFTDEERIYARDLMSAAVANIEKADHLVSRYLKEWKLERIAAMDRALLRLGTAEMLTKQSAPAVVIDEAVNLAKKYGDEKSAPFVNAVLDKIQQEISL